MRFLRRYFLVFVFTILTANLLNAQWVATRGPIEGIVLSLAVSTSETGDTNLYAGTWNGGVFHSTDKGYNWEEIDGGNWWEGIFDSGFTWQDIRHLVTSPNGNSGTSLWALDGRRNLFRSMNSDTNWTEVNNNIRQLPVRTVIIQDTFIFAGTDSGVFISTDYGTNWIACNNEIASYKVNSLTSILNDTKEGTSLFASTTGGIFRSTDNGTSWIVVNNNESELYILAVYSMTSGSKVFFATKNDRLFRSTDKGLNWIAVNQLKPFTDIDVFSLAIHDSTIFAGTRGYGVFFSHDCGESWYEANAGIGRRYIYSLLVSGDNLFAATYSDISRLNSVWHRPFSEMITGVKDKEKQKPDNFVLEQNFPNPFNPTTTISFSLPSRSFVSLKVFDGLGREVAVLLSEELVAGNYNQQWNASGFSNGVYYYRLQAGTYFQTKKLVLLK